MNDSFMSHPMQDAFTEQCRQVIVSLCEDVKTMSTTERRKVCDGLGASQFSAALSAKPRMESSLSRRKLRTSDVSVILKLAKILLKTHLYELGHIKGKQRQMRQMRQMETPVKLIACFRGTAFLGGVGFFFSLWLVPLKLSTSFN